MKLELYKKDSCPYCQKVLRAIRESGRTDIEMKDIITDDANREELVRVGKKLQVPCLFIDGKPMYESDDIIAWLNAHPQG